jgi:hypothetical protein
MSATDKSGRRRPRALTIYLILEGVSALVFQLIVSPSRAVMPRGSAALMPSGRAGTFATFRVGLKLIRLRPALLVILAIGFVYAFHREGFDHLWQKHLLDDFTLSSLGTLRRNGVAGED